MTRLIFFDIDGTISYSGQSPSQSTIRAIRKVRENGNMVFISTGRTVDSIPPIVAEIGFDGGIYSAGGITMYNNRVISQLFMPDNLARKVISLLEEKSTFFTLETSHGRFNSDNGHSLLSHTNLSDVSDDMKRFISNILFDPTASSLSKYSNQPVYKIAYYSVDPDIALQLSSVLDGAAKVVPFDDIPGFPYKTGEITDFSINKGRALKAICDHLNISPSACIAFGDSMNDAEIIEAAGIGIAMENAVPELKNLADKVCDRCENNGISKALHELGLI